MEENTNLTDDFKNIFPGKSDEQSNGIEYFNTIGNIRMICFEPSKGKCIALPYSHINADELDLQAGEIFLDFGNYKVRLRGNKMDKLFEQIVAQSVKYIAVVNPRYAATQNEESSFVTAMEIRNALGITGDSE